MNTRIKETGMSGSGVPVRLSLLAVALVSCQLVSAAEPGWYVGASIGESRDDVNDGQITDRLLLDGFTTVNLRETEEQTGFKVFSGYQFNQNLAIEGGYFDLGQFSYTARMEPWAIKTGDSELRGLNVDLIGFLPLSDKFSAFARAGLLHSQVKNRFRGYGAVTIDPFSTRETEINWKYGAGLQYDFTDKVALRLEAERYLIDSALSRDGVTELYSLGLVYRFGATAAPAPVPVSAPAPVAAAPRPAAPVATPPPTPVSEPEPVRVTFSADSLFDFDSSVVKPAGRAELDKLVADLRGVDFDTIMVTGHSDRVGSREYNLKLSNERAVSVKDYLVRSGNISASRVSTRGINGDEPVTRASQCGGEMSRTQRIACLAPDRRVEVEVSGTRPR